MNHATEHQPAPPTKRKGAPWTPQLYLAAVDAIAEYGQRIPAAEQTRGILCIVSLATAASCGDQDLFNAVELQLSELVDGKPIRPREVSTLSDGRSFVAANGWTPSPNSDSCWAMNWCGNVIPRTVHDNGDVLEGGFSIGLKWHSTSFEGFRNHPLWHSGNPDGSQPDPPPTLQEWQAQQDERLASQDAKGSESPGNSRDPGFTLSEAAELLGKEGVGVIFSKRDIPAFRQLTMSIEFAAILSDAFDSLIAKAKATAQQPTPAEQSAPKS